MCINHGLVQRYTILSGPLPFSLQIYKKYKEELYGLLVSLTSGEALGILKSMEDLEWAKQGGVLGVAMFVKNFDIRTKHILTSTKLT